ncbi:MAG: hypothetical protein CL431_04015 [Acidimicrobiaceae bacterium]|jgi:uncharacterized repeat protein (TIGR03843 family)|nr:hypothetical protein [Acidimicrobiaceae bacterium]|tara:strand:- start:210 stop:950 length:741 start_codon:yes stop_codon:yes gene_type:complete
MQEEVSPFRDRPEISNSDAIEILQSSKIEIIGRMAWSSNSTYLVNILDEKTDLQGIYKPTNGERPLWDFPSGLYRREIASFQVAQLIGWDIIPPTVETDGPFGIGSLQLFIPCDFDVHYFHMLEDPKYHKALQRICLFDFIANSTDRKGGHCLLGSSGRIWGIDNGLTFHIDFKLRTVIWDWAGEMIPEKFLKDIENFLNSQTGNELLTFLSPQEVDAIFSRATVLLESGRFPEDPSGTGYPWPII